MLIKWNKQNVWAVGLPGSQSGDCMVFVPGINEFPDDMWKAYDKHKGIKKFLEEGRLEVVEAPKGKKKEGEASDLSGMTVDEAKKIIKDTMRIDLLEKWLSEEERRGIIVAAQKRIKEIEESASKENDKE